MKFINIWRLIMGDILTGGQESGYADLSRALGQGVGQEQQYYQQGMGYLQPYQAGGSQALSSLLSQLGAGGTTQGGGQPQDAQSIIDRIQQHFQQTPAQQFEQQQATEAAQNQLQAQGIGGSGAAAKSLAQTVAGITGQQEQQNLQNVLGLRQQSLADLLSAAGLGAGAAGTGAKLSGSVADSIATLLAGQGKAQYGGDVAAGSALNKLISGGISSLFL